MTLCGIFLKNLEILVFQTWNHRNLAPPAVFRIPMEKEDLQQFCRQRWPNASDSLNLSRAKLGQAQLQLVLNSTSFYLYWIDKQVILLVKLTATNHYHPTSTRRQIGQLPSTGHHYSIRPTIPSPLATNSHHKSLSALFSTGNNQISG